MSVKTILSIAVGLLLIYLMFTVGAPFLLALVIAIFLEPLNQLFIRKMKMNRLAAATIPATIFTLLLLGGIVLLGVKIVAEVIAFFQKVPQYFENANVFVDQLMVDARGLFQNLPPDTIATLEDWLMRLTDAITKMAGIVIQIGCCNSFKHTGHVYFLYRVFGGGLYVQLQLEHDEGDFLIAFRGKITAEG